VADPGDRQLRRDLRTRARTERLLEIVFGEWRFNASMGWYHTIDHCGRPIIIEPNWDEAP
jgi:hypothetical protein